MSDYTVQNLKEVDDSATQFGLSPSLEARFARKPLGCEKAGISYQRLAPGFRVPFGHKHAEQEEIYVIAEGSGRIKLDDEVHDLCTWDILRIGPGVMRNLEAGPDGITLVAFGAPLGEQNDGELEPGWWAS